MSTISCGYRIYPAWFGHDDMSHAPIVELVHGTAARMGRRVADITVTGCGNNHRGSYIDFDVTYSSTQLVQQKGT